MVQQSLMELSLEARKRLINQGADSETIDEEWKIDMRYSGQSHELTIDVPLTSKDLIRKTRTLFEEDHHQAFGFRVGQRAEEHSIYDTEDGGRGAYSQSEGQGGHAPRRG